MSRQLDHKAIEASRSLMKYFTKDQMHTIKYSFYGNKYMQVEAAAISAAKFIHGSVGESSQTHFSHENRD